MRYLKTLILCMLVLGLVPSLAHAELVFFENIPDVPVMEGLRELPDYTVSFDKPEGRITESLAVIKKGDAGDVAAFYSQTLPQLGWQQEGELTYVRGGEHLEFKIEKDDGRSYVRVMIRPR